MQQMLNLLGDDSLIGYLAQTARKLNIAFDVVDGGKGREYIDSLHHIYEFGAGLRPEAGFSFRSGREAQVETFDNALKLNALLKQLARNPDPLCVFNHLGEHPWTYVFVLPDPQDLPELFRVAQPADYFVSDTQGSFLLAANWHDFSYAV
nr:hypothetical protein LVJ77_10620 [Conchiformibius kuhniae]